MRPRIHDHDGDKVNHEPLMAIVGERRAFPNANPAILANKECGDTFFFAGASIASACCCITCDIDAENNTKIDEKQ